MKLIYCRVVLLPTSATGAANPQRSSAQKIDTALFELFATAAGARVIAANIG
jgi:hypothetical protein|tara:strand:+ start:338 stop:493 length:156 start_codon:yes stop_codon:yes gene_type:complete